MALNSLLFFLTGTETPFKCKSCLQCKTGFNWSELTVDNTILFNFLFRLVSSIFVHSVADNWISGDRQFGKLTTV